MIRQRYSLDSSAVVVWLSEHALGARVHEVVTDPRADVNISAAALAEVVVVLERDLKADPAVGVAALRRAGVTLIVVDEEVALASREMRIRYKLHALDSLIAATAAVTRAVLLTCDNDFRAVSRRISVEFLRERPGSKR